MQSLAVRSSGVEPDPHRQPVADGQPVADQTEDSEPSLDDPELGAGNIRHRAVTGAVVDTLRAIGVRGVGVLGTLVTARLLTPYDFGLVAVGATILAFGDFLDDGGLGPALIRRPEAPARKELRALLAFQLALDVLIVVLVGLVMLPFGELGEVTTLIVISLPLGALRVPATIIYERRLDYRPMAVVEIVSTAVYFAWAIALIVVGWGVWALATAYIVRELVASVLMLILLREGRVLPVPSFTTIRPMLRFGVRYQATQLAHMLRDQGVNIAVATFGGVAMLGLWQIAWKILQIPIALFQALWRVAFPGMSRLVAAGEDLGPTIERVMGLVAIGTCAMLAPLAASAVPWIHILLGTRWSGAAPSIPPACFAMMFGVPISVALSGYLWAVGLAEVPLRAALFGIPAVGVIMLPLLPAFGIVAVGLGYIGSAAVESALFIYAARQTTSFTFFARVAVPVAAGALAIACGWLVARWVGPDLAGALASSVTAGAVFLGLLAAVHRSALAEAWRLIWRGMRGAMARSLDAPAHAQPKPAAG
ncbi:MAG TPA: oligosaccharide flippase family protein [Solirubrobacteraceae bacterium]|nr:oligosaccharide flippase family protein [Solirubrobacteraceae bacterium]